MKVRRLLNVKPTSVIPMGTQAQAISFSSEKNVSGAKGGSKANFFDQASRDWDKAWQMNLTPWDLKGTVAPPLKQLFDESSSQITNGSFDGKHALVPGCGSGYECSYLASVGFQSVTGLDISPTAIQFASENIKNSDPQKKLPGNLTMEVGDFFKYEAPKGHKYDFIFDYLFFAALDPPLRSHWANAMTRLLTPQTGYLATLIFPLAPPTIAAEEKAKGPPYPVSLEDYNAELTNDRWELVSINKVCIILFELFDDIILSKNDTCGLQDVKSIKPRMGREVMALWRLKQ